MPDTRGDSNAPVPAVVWKARPIFLSSTFRDMHAERDYLREHGFKVLEERMRERCHYLDVIDLRQGVETGDAADEAEREMRVLKVCLDKIERLKSSPTHTATCRSFPRFATESNGFSNQRLPQKNG